MSPKSSSSRAELVCVTVVKRVKYNSADTVSSGSYSHSASRLTAKEHQFLGGVYLVSQVSPIDRRIFSDSLSLHSCSAPYSRNIHFCYSSGWKMLKRKSPGGQFTCQFCFEESNIWHEFLRHSLKAHSFCLYCKIQVPSNSGINSVFDHLLDHHCESAQLKEENEALKTKMLKLETKDQKKENDKADFLQMAVDFFKQTWYKEADQIGWRHLCPPFLCIWTVKP